MKITYAQPNPVCVVAQITADDGSRSWVICSVPGGTPRFTFTDPTKPGPTRVHESMTSIVDAPQCDNMKQFRTFVAKRFG